MAALPNPWICPVVTVPVAGALLGFSRSASYRATANGVLPVIGSGHQLRVPTAALYRQLGLPLPPPPGRPAVR